MSKYSPLWEHLSKSKPKEMTMDEIKNVLGFPIDHSFLTYKKELLSYGMKVKKIHMKESFIEFEEL